MDPNANEEVLNEQLLEALQEAQEGPCKNASLLTGRFIRRKIRENGFGRRVLPFEDVTKEDLSDSFEELPMIIEEMEADQPGAVAANYNDTPDTAFFRGDKFAVLFYLIITPQFTKNVFELLNYKSDIREITTANMLKDIHTQEDTKFMIPVNQIVGSPSGVGASGQQQNFEILGRIARVNYVENTNHLEDKNLNNGVFLVNRRTAKEFLKWGRDELGGDKAQDLAFEGLETLTEFKFFGVPHIATIKRGLVPDNVIYKFAEPGYLGRAYRLQDITTFVKKEVNVLRMHAQECIGLTFSNLSALSKSTHIL
jgi:hypothetical protein